MNHRGKQPKTRSTRLCIVGDVHGELASLRRLLCNAALIDECDRWIGSDAALWFMGDYFDRGPDGIGVVDLLMRLQREAGAVGGQVGALIGNHEPLLLAAHRFGERPTGYGGTFRSDWERNGGQPSDLDRLTDAHIDWLINLPAMTLVDRLLLIHADARLYERYGTTVDAVNHAIASVLHGDDVQAWDILLEQFGQRHAFDDGSDRANERAARFLARRFLDIFGGNQIVHGHTPIDKMTGQPPHMITSPLIYADGLCVNVDHGLYRGGSGFVYEARGLGSGAGVQELGANSQ